MHLFNLCDLEYCLYWQNLISFSFGVRVGERLTFDEITVSLYYPKVFAYYRSDFSYLWDAYKKSGGPDDMPF